MKKVILSSLILMLVSSISYSQSYKNDLKGPKAKNYKPWKNTEKAENNIVYTDTQTKPEGLKAKNHKPWENKENQDYVAANYIEAKKSRLMGPKAKNYKPAK